MDVMWYELCEMREGDSSGARSDEGLLLEESISQGMRCLKSCLTFTRSLPLQVTLARANS
jgi:hypothetical protein